SLTGLFCLRLRRLPELYQLKQSWPNRGSRAIGVGCQSDWIESDIHKRSRQRQLELITSHGIRTLLFKHGCSGQLIDGEGYELVKREGANTCRANPLVRKALRINISWATVRPAEPVIRLLKMIGARHSSVGKIRYDEEVIGSRAGISIGAY